MYNFIFGFSENCVIEIIIKNVTDVNNNNVDINNLFILLKLHKTETKKHTVAIKKIMILQTPNFLLTCFCNMYLLSIDIGSHPILFPLRIYAKSSDKSNDRMWFSPFCNRYLCDVFVCLLFQTSAKMRKGRQGCGLVAKSLKGGGKSHASFYKNNF